MTQSRIPAVSCSYALVRSSALLACLASVPALSADWAFDPILSVSAEYNDNNRMDQPGDEITVSGGVLDAQVVMSASTPTTTFSLTPRLTSSLYPGDELEETDNQFLRFRLLDTRQRLDTRFNADYSRVETLGDYFPGAEVRDDDQLGDPDSGVDATQTGSRNREDRFKVAPGLTFRIDERQTLDVNLEYMDVGYDREEPGDRQSYTNLGADLGYKWAMDEASSIGLYAGLVSYEPDDGESSDSYSLAAEWGRRWSKTAEAYVRTGAYFVEAVEPGDSGKDAGFSGGAGVRWEFEITEIFLDANQYADPSSSGDLVERTQLRFQVSRQLSPTSTMQVGLRGINDSGLAGQEGIPGKKYVSADIGFRWRMTRAMTLFGGYGYRWRDKDNEPDTADANRFNLGVIWEPNRK